MANDTYLTLLGSIIQGLATLMGIVAVVLIFLIDQRLSQATKILDDLDQKYYENKLNKVNVKRYLMLYVHKLDSVHLNSFFYNMLIAFYAGSSLTIIFSLYLLVEMDNFYISVVTICSFILIFFFLVIIYFVANAPYGRFFKEFNPKYVVKEPHHKEVLSKYIGCYDMEDVYNLYSKLEKSKKNR